MKGRKVGMRLDMQPRMTGKNKTGSQRMTLKGQVDNRIGITLDAIQEMQEALTSSSALLLWSCSSLSISSASKSHSAAAKKRDYCKENEIKGQS